VTKKKLRGSHRFAVVDKAFTVRIELPATAPDAVVAAENEQLRFFGEPGKLKTGLSKEPDSE
jgi:hypothetical protein